MRLKSLQISNLRNISSAEIALAPGINVFHGANGAGKTTILESLLMLAKGRSFRSNNVRSLIGPGSETLLVVAEIEADDGQLHRIGIQRSPSDWKARLDGTDVRQLSELSAFFPFVLMEPNSHLLVSGSPDHRRRFLDWGVFHVKHSFLDDWRRYNRALKQRNAALRRRERSMVQSLDPQIAALGESIDRQRKEVIDQQAPVVAGILAQLSTKLGDPELKYSPGWSDETLSDALDRALESDLERGSTRPGPHRADVLIRVRGKAARDRLSRGEQKIVAASMLLAQAQLLEEAGRSPVLLLDDLASEFDAEHLSRVLDWCAERDVQVLITGTDALVYESGPQNSSNTVFHVKQGVVAAA